MGAAPALTWRHRAVAGLLSLAAKTLNVPVNATDSALITALLGADTGQMPRLGTAALLRAYSTMPWLRAAVNKISWSVATTRWRLFVVRRTSEDRKAIAMPSIAHCQDPEVRRRQLHRLVRRQADPTTGLAAGLELQELESHPLLTLLDHGNPKMPGVVARQVTQQHLELVGEGALVLDRNGLGMPTDLWPLPPSWITELPSARNGMVYRVNVPNAGPREFADEDVIWLYHPDPARPYDRGTGFGHALGDELETDEYAAKHLKSTFFNRARPDLLISADGLQKADTDRLEQRWMEKLGGVWKSGRPFFFSRKLEVKELNQSLKDLGIGEIRKDERDVILHVFGFPPEIFGILESSNRATIESADYLYEKHLVTPRREFLRAWFQQRLVPLFDERIILEYDAPSLEDKDFSLNVMKAMPEAFRVDEWRARASMPALPDEAGEVHLVRHTIRPVRDVATFDEPDEPPPTDPGASPAPQGGSPEGSGENDPTAGQARARLRAVTKQDEVTLDDLVVIVAALRDEPITVRTLPAIREAIVYFGQQALDDVGASLTFDLVDARVLDFLDRWGAERVTRINATTREALRATLTEAVAAGESTRDIVNRIRSVFAQARKSRAQTIARTEIVRASNFAVVAGLIQAAVPQKEWLSTEDARVRDTHQALDGQIRSVSEPFESPSGGRAQYPGDFGIPEEDINCRCGVLSVIDPPPAGDEPAGPGGETGQAAAVSRAAEARAARWRAIEADRVPFTRMAERALRAAFRQQEEEVLAALAERVGDEEIDA